MGISQIHSRTMYRIFCRDAFQKRCILGILTVNRTKGNDVEIVGYMKNKTGECREIFAAQIVQPHTSDR